MKKYANEDWKITLDDLMNYYYSLCDDEYIPSLINEGNLYDEKRDLYAKLILLDKNTDINSTWMLDNLALHPLKNAEKGYNLIIFNKYKSNDKYILNPNLIDNSYVTFTKQTSSKCFDLEYLGDNSLIKRKVLISKDNNVFIYFPVLTDYLNPHFNPSYNLYLEFEYREYIDDLNSKSEVKKINNGYIDFSYDKEKLNISEEKPLYWLRGTIKLDIKKFSLNRKKSNSNSKIKVVDLTSQKIRNLNEYNYDDDTNAGLVVFSNKAITEIKKFYYFYDLLLIPKLKDLNQCLVDYVDDYIIFWEGEYNSNLPEELKKKIEIYNIDNKTNNIISNAMYKWQLMASFNIFNDLLPNQRIARYFREKHFNKSIENQLDFYPVSNINEYSLFVKKILNIISLDDVIRNLNQEQKSMLNKIIDGSYIFSSQYELEQNYMYFCNLLIKVVNYEEE